MSILFQEDEVSISLKGCSYLVDSIESVFLNNFIIFVIFMKELKLEDILATTSNLTQTKKVWYVAIIGRPNAGKSTFINTLIWEKVAITSHIPQTTRNKILAVYNDADSQILFFDTPGIHKDAKLFNQAINNQALSSLQEAQVVLHFIDGSRPYWEEEQYIQELLQDLHIPVFVVYTKSDLPQTQRKEKWENIFYISSLEKKGFEALLLGLKQELSEGPLLFGEDFYTKQNIFFRISEIIREKVFLHTKEELPHSIFVSVEEVEETPDHPLTPSFPRRENSTEKWLIKIIAYINTETESQKYIIIGKGWSLIAQIGKEARLELEEIFWRKVFLALRAKVMKKWRKNETLVKNLLQ